jgi:hypothetical protein
MVEKCADASANAMTKDHESMSPLDFATKYKTKKLMGYLTACHYHRK